MRNLLPLGLVGLLLIAWSAGLAEHVSLAGFIRHREELAGLVAANFPLALAAYMLLYAALVTISFPGASLLTVAGGFLFGGLIAGTATVLAASIGAILVFLAARTSLADLFNRRAGGFVARFAEGFRGDAFAYLLSLRLTPVFPFWVVNIVPGLLNVRLAPYAAATLIGIVPGTLAYAFVGAGLDSVIAAQELADPGCAAAGTCSIDPSRLVTPQILMAMVALGLVSLLPPLLRRYGPLARNRR